MTNSFFNETPEATQKRMAEEDKNWTPEAIKQHYENLPTEGQPTLGGKINRPGTQLDWTYNDDTISVTSEPRGLTFARRGREHYAGSGGQRSYDVCILREDGESDDQIIKRYKAGLDERLIREAV